MKSKQVIVFALLSCAPLAFAQTPEKKPTEIGKPDGKMHASAKDPCLVHKQSDVLGADVRNLEGENLGEIDDLVINPASGQIEYAALSFGGVLGMGDKLFAVPWSVLSSTHDDDGEHKHFVLSIPKERLEKSPGFPKDNWPDVSTPEWSDTIKKYYADDIRGRPVPMDSGEDAGKAIAANKTFHLMRASDLKGCEVETQDGSDAGEISEVVIDPSSGRIPYVILSDGGFLGFGTDKYAVPWKACGFTVDEDKDVVCKLNVPKAVFEKAPAYKDDDWKSMSDPVYVERVYTHYGYPPYSKKTVEAGSKHPGSKN